MLPAIFVSSRYDLYKQLYFNFDAILSTHLEQACFKIISCNYMEYVRFNYNDTTHRVPHFEMNAFYKGKWIGHYQRRGDLIENVFIVQEMRGKGMCQMMLRHEIKQKKHLRIQVLESNLAAKRCYMKLGFKEVSLKNGIIDMLHK